MGKRKARRREAFGLLYRLESCRLLSGFLEVDTGFEFGCAIDYGRERCHSIFNQVTHACHILIDYSFKSFQNFLILTNRYYSLKKRFKHLCAKEDREIISSVSILKRSTVLYHVKKSRCESVYYRLELSQIKIAICSGF